MCVCVRVFLLRRVAGNVSIAPRVSEIEILDFIYLFLLGGLACVILLNNVKLSSLLWEYHSSNYIFDCSAVSSSQFSFCWSSGEFPV